MSKKSLSQSVNDVYDEFIQSVLYYYRMFEYNIDVMTLLYLPYNLFVDLILKQVSMKKKEVEFENRAVEEHRVKTIKAPQFRLKKNRRI